jgi:hypothetical protein
MVEVNWHEVCIVNSHTSRRFVMGLILLIVLIVLLLGAAPTWPHSRQWGYGPSGLLGMLLLVFVVLMLFNALPFGWYGPRVVGV